MPTTFLLLFRGVGGATQLPVAPLREALTKAGFKQATTYINSGNALVRSTLSREETIAKVAALCKKKFGFDKAIFAPTAAEWAAVIRHDPFPQKAEGKHVHAALLAEKPDAAAIKILLTFAVEGEDLKVLKSPVGAYHVAYLHTPHGLGTSLLGAKFDKGLGVANTARNWNTVLKMHGLAQGLEGK
ncbi:MAG: DUF1697 domain-containing protein [Flavobacteriales bacterium]|nr:DUF1697 domain-containing protein [Flavobacteriales bacterium]MBP9081313.1 DUF1697 domain-containing protein [Flavobacteriales bacterium]